MFRCLKQIQFKIVLATQILLAGLLLQSCTAKDTTVKADLISKAKEKKDFAGVRFTVDKGIVTLSGDCPTEGSKSTVETTVKNTFGVKQVINKIAIAPVIIGTDQQLKQAVDSVLQSYPGVEAITRDSVVFLQGKLPAEAVLKLKKDINTLKPRMVDPRLTSG